MNKLPILLPCLFCLILPIILPSCASASTGQAVADNVAHEGPDWVYDPYSKYDRQANVAAVGSGNSREAAEKSALGNLIAIFGQNIQVDERVSVAYREDNWFALFSLFFFPNP